MLSPDWRVTVDGEHLSHQSMVAGREDEKGMEAEGFQGGREDELKLVGGYQAGANPYWTNLAGDGSVSGYFNYLKMRTEEEEEEERRRRRRKRRRRRRTCGEVGSISAAIYFSFPLSPSHLFDPLSPSPAQSACSRQDCEPLP